jgi:hypothetical protein
LPSIIPSYIYTLFASMIVGALLIFAFNATTLPIRNEAEQQQLKHLSEYVATRSCELVSVAAISNMTIRLALNLPTFVGNQRYWLQLKNDSSVTWVESGFGAIFSMTEHRMCVPEQTDASGIYVSGSGAAFLECQASDSTILLRLSGGS